ncbi:MAG: hypothetical protein ACI4OY_08100 [Aristaeellaceae bacterium]
MRSYGILLRLSLKNTLASLRTGVTNRKTGRISIGYVLLAILGCAGLLGLAVALGVGESYLFNGLVRLGQPLLLPTLVMMLCMICTLLFSAFHTLSRLYFSRDTAWLASLPVTSRTVMASRLTEVCLGEMGVNLLLMLPSLVLLGMHLGGGVGYWFRAGVTLVVSVAMPVAVTTLLSALLTRITGFTRHKEALLMAGSILLMAAVLTLELSVMPRIPDDADATFFISILLSRTGLIDALTSAFPPLRWAVNGLAGDWAGFGLFLLVSVASLGLVVALMGGRYLNDCIRQSEQAARRRGRRAERTAGQQQSQLVSLFRRECLEILRTPTYAFNSLGSVIFMPLMLVIMLISISSTDVLPEVMQQLSGLLGMIPGTDMLLLCTLVMCIGCWINPAVSTAVTREGKHHDLYRMMPVTPATCLNAKLLMGMSINQLSALVTGILFAAVLGRYALWLLPGFVLAVAVNYTCCAFSLTIDALHPNYDWVNETQAIKQSMNVMWGMLAVLILLLMPCAAWGLVWYVQPGQPLLRLAAVLAVIAGEALGGRALLNRLGMRSYAASEG